MNLQDLKILVDRLYDQQNTYEGNRSEMVSVCVRDKDKITSLESISLNLGVLFLNINQNGSKNESTTKNTVNNLRNKSNKGGVGKVS